MCCGFSTVIAYSVEYTEQTYGVSMGFQVDTPDKCADCTHCAHTHWQIRGFQRANPIRIRPLLLRVIPALTIKHVALIALALALE